MIPIIYSPKYEVDIGEHVFPAQKYRLLYDKLLTDGVIAGKQVLQPRPATREELSTTHTKEYLDDLDSLRLTERTAQSELPLTKNIIDAYILCAGGSVLAVSEALKAGCAFHIGGGFHHAFSDHAEGFCYINDIAVAAKDALIKKLCQKVLIIDCDLHQGNGTAKIFENDSSVFTFSIHQENNYPPKQKSDLDIGLDDYAGDKIYLKHLHDTIPEIINLFGPDLILYLAGADPFEVDQLGKLKLTFDGLRERDEFILTQARDNKIPAAVVLAGGYACDANDTVRIHYNTFMEMKKIFC